MLTTYEATLRDNHIEWKSDSPRHLEGRSIEVYVTLLDEVANGDLTQGQRMAAALQKIAESHALAGINPAQWEREERSDRPLPTRDQ